MKSKLTGWKNVFTFTLVQTAKSKSFLSSTITMLIILFAVLIGVNVYSASTMESKSEGLNIEYENVDSDLDSYDSIEVVEEVEKNSFVSNIYIKDETGLGIDQEGMEEYLNHFYESIQLQTSEKSHDDLVEETKNQDDMAYVHLTFDGSEIKAQLFMPEGSIYPEEQAEIFAYSITSYISIWKDNLLALNEEQAEFLNATISSFVVGDEEKSFSETMVGMYAPMVMCLLLYMCIVLYGQMVGNSVANEKSSKVMELLLTSVKPLAIIVGKVLSMMALALIQLVGYIVIGVGANKIGTIFGQNINPAYGNVVTEFLDGYNLLSILSPARLFFAFLVFVLGFMFYCTLAGLMGATVNRGEDLASAMSVYSVVAMIGFFLAYFPNILSSVGTGLVTFTAIFPISSPFVLPAQVLVGTMSWKVLLIGFVLLAIFVVAFIIFVAKVYEMVILFNGNKLKLKDIKKFLREA